MSDTVSREAFEAWMRADTGYAVTVDKASDGTYNSTTTQMKWLAWQAALRIAAISRAGSPFAMDREKLLEIIDGACMHYINENDVDRIADAIIAACDRAGEGAK